MKETTIIAKGYGIIIVIGLFGLLLLSSCSRNGYGCRGNQSWGKMVKRINSGY